MSGVMLSTPHGELETMTVDWTVKDEITFNSTR